MKIYLSLAVLSVAVGAWLGATTPREAVPQEIARYHSAPQESVVMRVATIRQFPPRPAGS
jgi:hypothetical protein